MKPSRLLRLGVLLLAAHVRAGDSVPPLTDGKAPATLDAMWGDFDPRKELLETEVLKEWEVDGVVCRLLRYQVGVFKGSPTRVAAFFAFPKGAAKLPAILELHGGGQSANVDSVVAFAQRGYAGLSLNWGGNKLNFGRSKETYAGPQTDWGKLDATHPPQRNKVNHFAGPLTPDEYTLDAVESPRNSNWFLVLVAARRAITFLEQQPEVDPARIGVCGHSMGGKLTTNLAGIDRRVRAAVPSCGGSGIILESQTDLPGCHKTTPSALEFACVSDNAYIPRIACPVLWLSPANDFHAHIDNMAWNWRDVPDAIVRFSIAPHLNHRHTAEHGITQHLWFEQHLKGAFTMPQTPTIELSLKTAEGVPVVTVAPDGAMPVRRVDICYAVDPHALTRFWRDAGARREGDTWRAACPVLSREQPLFVYANAVYDTPMQHRNLACAPGQENSDTFAISSRVLSASPAQLQAAGVNATDKPERMIDDGSRGWRDWYCLNWGHPPLWTAYTRKLKDPKWRGPDGARLLFDIKSQTDNALVVKVICNEWGAFAPGKPAVDYTVLKELKGSPDWQTVAVSLAELTATDPAVTAPPADWRAVAEFGISPSGEIVRDGKQVKVDGKPWQGGRGIRNLRWEGGEYPAELAKPSALSGAAVPAAWPTPPEVWRGYDPDTGDFKEEIVAEGARDGVRFRDTYISAYVLGEEIRVYCKYAVKAGATNAPGLMNVHGWMSAPGIDAGFVRDGWAVMAHDYCGKTGDRPHYTKYPDKLRYGNMDAAVGYRVKSRTPDGKDITDPRQTDDYLWYAIQRRVLSYLQAQKEVDRTRIGAQGYSYGGTLMWNLGMDPRVKAIVAYFGIGWLDYYRDKRVFLYNVPYVEPPKTPGEELLLAAIAPEAHAPYIRAASLWLPNWRCNSTARSRSRWCWS